MVVKSVGADNVTGVFPTVVEKRLSRVINAAGFSGVDITGATDSTAGIQAAIDAASVVVGTDPTGATARSGAIVDLPPGYYLISSTLTIAQHGVTLRGAGRISTRIIAAAAFPTSTPMVKILKPSGTTVFESRLENLTLNCRDITGSIGVLTNDAQEGCGLRGVRIRNYRDAGFRAVSDATGEDAAETVIDSCEFWASASGSNYGIDFDTTVGAHYVSRTTVLALSDWTLGTSHTAAIRVKSSRASIRDIHIEDYFDGIFVDTNGTVAASQIKGDNGPGQDATHALVHIGPTGSGHFEALHNGTGNTLYTERYARLVGTGYVPRYSIVGSQSTTFRPDFTGGTLEARSADSTVPALVLRNTTSTTTGPVIQSDDSGSNTTFTVKANGLTTVGRSGVTQWDNGHLIIGVYHFWVDSNGTLRFKSSAPASNGDGMPVATGDTPVFKSARYVVPPCSQTNSAIAIGSFRCYLLRIPRAITFDRIGISVTTGVATAVVRLGVYADDGTGMPGSLVLDAGTVDGSAIATPTITISQSLGPGDYWIGGAAQVAGSPPTVQANNGALPGMTAIGISEASQNVNCYEMTGVTGALPGTFTLAAAQSTGHRVLLRTT